MTTMTIACPRVVFALVVALSFEARMMAQEGDRLDVSLSFADLRPGSEGGGAEVVFSRDLSARVRLRLGGGVQGLGETRWAYGALGLVARPVAGLVVLAALDAGRGRDAEGSFPYLVGRVLVDRRMTPTLDLSAEAVVADLGDVSGNVLRMGGTLTLSPGLRAGLQGLVSLGGDLETRAGSLRVDRDLANGVSVFGVLTVGRLSLLDPAVASRRTRGAYVLGSSFNVLGTRLTAALDVTDLGEARRISLLLAARLPL